MAEVLPMFLPSKLFFLSVLLAADCLYSAPIQGADDGAKPMVSATQSVVLAIVESARQNRLAAEPAAGDRLTELYVRSAAAAACNLPTELSAKAFLLGIGIGLDDSIVLRANLLTRNLCRQVESDSQRIARLKVLGSPTMHRRRDLAKHFAVSAALTVTVGPRVAESAGLMKELNDSHGGTGFSFADLTADLAGVRFAVGVRDAKIRLKTLATSFAVKDFLPDVSDLKEGIAWEEFTKTYGSVNDERFQRQQKAIRERILALPGFR